MKKLVDPKKAQAIQEEIRARVFEKYAEGVVNTYANSADNKEDYYHNPAIVETSLICHFIGTKHRC